MTHDRSRDMTVARARGGGRVHCTTHSFDTAVRADLAKMRLQAESGKIEDGVFTTGLRKGTKPRIRGVVDVLSQMYAEGEISRGRYTADQSADRSSPC